MWICVRVLHLIGHVTDGYTIKLIYLGSCAFAAGMYSCYTAAANLFRTSGVRISGDTCTCMYDSTTTVVQSTLKVIAVVG